MPSSNISRETGITVGLLLVILAFVASGAWWAAAVSSDVSDIRQSVDEFKMELREAAVSRWKKSDMIMLWSVLGDLNPDLNLPSIPE